MNDSCILLVGDNQNSCRKFTDIFVMRAVDHERFNIIGLIQNHVI